MACFSFLTPSRTNSPSEANEELGSHTKRERRGACSPAASAGIFAQSAKFHGEKVCACPPLRWAFLAPHSEPAPRAQAKRKRVRIPGAEQPPACEAVPAAVRWQRDFAISRCKSYRFVLYLEYCRSPAPRGCFYGKKGMGHQCSKKAERWRR